MIISIVTEGIRAVNHFIGKFKQQIILQILATRAPEDVDSLVVIGFMRIGG